MPDASLARPGAYRELEYRRSERDLRAFVRAAWPVIEPQESFVSNWHLDAICDHLMAVSLGHIRHLVINIPPRHAKSSVTSVLWPAWEWVLWPHIRSLYISHKLQLSIRDSVRTRRVIESAWYQARWGDRFTLTGDQNAKMRFENDMGGFRLVGSFDSGVTGEGGDKVVVDDPIDLSEGDNLNELERVIDIWDRAIYSRVNNPRTGARVIIMQRVHDLDLSGHVLGTGEYTHLMLPAEYDSRRRCFTFGSVRPALASSNVIQLGKVVPSPFGKQRACGVDFRLVQFEDPRREEGTLLWPQRFGPNEIAFAKSAAGAGRYFEGQYNQNPVPRDGALFPADGWRYWDRPPVDNQGRLMFDDYLQSWDCAFKDEEDSDYVVGTVWGKLGVNFYLLDLVRGRLSFTKTCAAIERLTIRWPMVTRKLVEDAANGPAVIDALKGKVAGLLPVRPLGGKLSRANAAAPLHEGGNLYLPSEKAEWPIGEGDRQRWDARDTSWVQDFIVECARFPKGVNDDQVDSMTQALNFWIPRITSMAQVPVSVGEDRPSVFAGTGGPRPW